MKTIVTDWTLSVDIVRIIIHNEIKSLIEKLNKSNSYYEKERKLLTDALNKVYNYKTNKEYKVYIDNLVDDININHIDYFGKLIEEIHLPDNIDSFDCSLTIARARLLINDVDDLRDVEKIVGELIEYINLLSNKVNRGFINKEDLLKMEVKRTAHFLKKDSSNDTVSKFKSKLADKILKIEDIDSEIDKVITVLTTMSWALLLEKEKRNKILRLLDSVSFVQESNDNEIIKNCALESFKLVRTIR